MSWSWNRILSGSLAAIYIVGAYLVDGAKGAFILTLFCILPLGCIWFSDAMGDYVGLAWHGVITQRSPGLAV